MTGKWRMIVIVCGCSLWTVGSAQGSIDLELRPCTQIANVGSVLDVGLYAVSDNTGNQLMSAADVILGWTPGYLDLLGNDDSGAVPLLVSGFPVVDLYSLNEVVPPQDGDGLYLAYAFPGQPVVATPAGTLLTTLNFRALIETCCAGVSIMECGGSPLGYTVVYDGTVPNLDVTGELGAATVAIVPEPCTGIGYLFVALMLSLRRNAG